MADGSRLPTSSLAALTSLLAAAGRASAHAGGTPSGEAAQASLPSWVVWLTGAGVVALSFAVVALVGTRKQADEPRQAEVVDGGDVTGLPRGLVTVFRVAGLLLFLGAIAPALIPWNRGWAAPRLVWLGLWTALPVLCYLVGNLWAVISPYRSLAGIADRMRGDSQRIAYPESWGAWPSVVLLVVLVALEVTVTGQDPVLVARLAIGYSAFTLIGMMVFGSQVWLTRAEVLDRVFAWWSTMAPVQLTAEGFDVSNPVERLGRQRALGAGDASFLVVLLYGVNFDSFLATPLGDATLDGLSPLGSTGATLVVLASGLTVFLGVFWGCVALVRRAAGSLRAPADVGSRVVVGLLPIAVGYHLAHAGPYLVEQLPLLWETLSDPLALNPTTAGAFQIPAAAGVWIAYTQLGLIVVAHVVAVVAAHAVATNAFASRVQALKSEAPVTALMVVYTFVGLWLAGSGVGALGGSL